MRLFEGTEFDRPPKCDECDQLVADCQCPPPVAPQVPANQQTLRLSVEKRKKGKWVTVIRNLATGNEHSELLTYLKNSCGAGGTVQDSTTIEIQGDHLSRIQDLLRNQGYHLHR